MGVGTGALGEDADTGSAGSDADGVGTGAYGGAGT